MSIENDEGISGSSGSSGSSDDVDVEGYCNGRAEYTHSIVEAPQDTRCDRHTIDLHIAIHINILEYLTGCVKQVKYVDDTMLDIRIEPFSTNDIVIKNKGLLGGNLNVKIIFKNITIKDWKKISEKKRARIIKLISKLYP
jgi:DnaJ-class molecular chaperone